MDHMGKNPVNISKNSYRLVFERAIYSANHTALRACFQKELGLSGDRIETLLQRPPGVLMDSASRHDVELLQRELENMGGLAALFHLVTFPSLPFHLCQEHERQIKRELSKTLRCRARLALILVQVETDPQGAEMPSMLGSFSRELSAEFRESDTVIGIDDRRLILLGFATDRKGSVPLRNKLSRILKVRLGDQMKLSMGRALFPEDARNLRELICLAEEKRHGGKGGRVGKATGPPCDTAAPKEKKTAVSGEEEKGAAHSLQSGFVAARGRGFLRLLAMDPHVLWRALCQLPRAGQVAFLNRIPVDSPMLPVLAEMIRSQKAPAARKQEEQYAEAIFEQMELSSGITGRLKTRDRILALLSEGEDLPTLPAVASEIFQLASTPNASAEDLTAVIMNDPSLTSKLLKTVNSAYYGRTQEIESLQDAVVHLGTEEVVDFAFGLAAAKVFDIAAKTEGVDPKALWHHCLFTALIAQDLCRNFPEAGVDSSRIFTAGLLHDVGKIFVMESYAVPYREILGHGSRHLLPIFELEEEILGVSHATIGRHLSCGWNLPQPLVQAIAFHHQPAAAPDYSRLCAIVGFADYLYYEAIRLDDAQSRADGWLTYGHWRILTRMFPGLTTDRLGKMVKDTQALMSANADLIEIFN